MSLPATLRQNSTWTPKSHAPSNQKIFEERMGLIKKWYAAWNDDQRWTLLEYLLRRQNDSQLLLIHSLLHPAMPPPDHDFTRVLPRYLTLKIFSLLDPQSLCRAAQVCWFWKFLAESNSIWQKKCLKLGWFLPTPPLYYDYTVWKRHYIACVCQLHWNPPQAPECDDEDNDLDLDIPPPEETTTKKKRHAGAHRHTLSIEERRPWRDPDRNPHDIYFQHNTLYHSILGLRQQVSQGQTYTTPLQPTLLGMGDTTEPPYELPPPDSLIHPVLLEKMRLGSPSTSHMQLSTLNIDQSQQDIHETFYDLHKSNPFPRLPPYYVHKPESLDQMVKSDTVSNHSTSRPPSGRLKTGTKGRPNSGKVTLSAGASDKVNQSPRAAKERANPLLNSHTYKGNQTDNVKQDRGLRSRPWSIPTESDDEI